MPDTYTLVLDQAAAGDTPLHEVGPGHTIDPQDMPVFGEPRKASFTERLNWDGDFEPPTLQEMLNGEGDARLVQVSPSNDTVFRLHTDDEAGDVYTLSTGRWTVTGPTEPKAFIGPQADEVIAAMRLSEKMHSCSDYEPCADGCENCVLFDRYDTALRDLYDGRPSPHELTDYLASAFADAGLDQFWWSQYAFACNFGPEILAITALDLVAEGTRWNAAAYNRMTMAWRVAFPEAEAPGRAL